MKLLLLNSRTQALWGTNLPRNAIGYWSMDVGTGNKLWDLSGQGNHGEMTDCVWSSGKAGPSVVFGGVSSLVDCGSKASLFPTDKITVLARVKIASTHATEVRRIIGDYYEAPRYKGYALRITATTTTVVVGLNINQTFRTIEIGTLGLNTWADVGFTFDGSALTPYLNGVSGVAAAYSGAIEYASSPKLWVGCYNGVSYWFDGEIEFIHIYNACLSSELINRLYPF